MSRVKGARVLSAALALAAVAAGFAPASAPAAVSFGAPAYTGVWGDPFAIEAPDLNGDGHPDLVAGIAGEVGSEIVLELGDGKGGFDHEEQYELAGDAAFGIAVADLDGDGKLDVAAALNGAPSGKEIGVLRGEGNGFLRDEPFYFSVSPGSGPLAIAAGRFTGRAQPDLVVGDDSNEVSLLENTSTPGKPSFAAAKQFAAGHTPAALAVADFNGDGIPDVAVADSAEGGKPSGFTILDGTGTSSGFGAAKFTALGENILGVATGDFNGDGYPDLALFSYEPGLFPKGAVYVLLNNKHGEFESAGSYDTSGRPEAIATARIGGVEDLLVAEGGRLSESGRVLLLANNGHGSFSEAGRFPSEEGFGPLLATDLAGDGAPDILEGDSNGTVATLMDLGVPEPSPASLSFGSVADGQDSAQQSVTITNTGAAPAAIDGLALAGSSPGEFDLDDAGGALGAGTCSGATLAPGGSCSATVAFRPTQVGPVGATLLVFSDGSPASVALAGTGTPAATPPPPAPAPLPLPLALGLAKLGHPRLGAHTISVRATCPARCLLKLTLSVSRSAARKLHLHGTTLASTSATITGTRTLTLKLSGSLAARIAKLHSLTITLAGVAEFIGSRSSARTSLALSRH